jgi:DNA-binding response OmpR family regulator
MTKEKAAARCCPIAYLTVHDGACRSRIADALHRQGWTVIEKPTGFHLVEAIAEVIEGGPMSARPGLIVVDAASRGCSGASIATGLRDLGERFPIVLVTRPGDRAAVSDMHDVHVADTASAPARIAALARPLSPLGLLEQPRLQPRAMA